MDINLEERQTARKRIRVERLWDGRICVDGSKRSLEELIRCMADEGFNFAGKINEYIPTGPFGMHTEDFLFIKAEDS